MFTDDSTSCDSACNSTQVWRSPRLNKFDPKLVRKIEKFPTKVMVLGSMGYRGVGDLVVFENNERVNQQIY